MQNPKSFVCRFKILIGSRDINSYIFRIGAHRFWFTKSHQLTHPTVHGTITHPQWRRPELWLHHVQYNMSYQEGIKT